MYIFSWLFGLVAAACLTPTYKHCCVIISQKSHWLLVLRMYIFHP